MQPVELANLITATIHQEIHRDQRVTSYRTPIVGFLSAADPRFSQLEQLTGGKHLLPDDLLPGARSVVCFFLPFAPEIVHANRQEKIKAARQWAIAYQETNALIGAIISRLSAVLAEQGLRTAAQPATGNFGPNTLRSQWSHKSMAVLSGIGSFGLHQMVITDAGCAGRFGSLVMDAELPVELISQKPAKERCLYYSTGECLDCVVACPAAALDPSRPIDRQACHQQCRQNATEFLDLGENLTVCGKCAVVGPCALEAAVQVM